MFSTNQTSYIDSFLATYAAKEFKYYIAYTDTSTSYYNTYPDLYIIFSKEEIIAQDGYTYALPADSVQLAIRTGNYSSNSSADNSDRVVQTVLQEQTLTVDEYEHIYTNATFEGYALQPDYYLASGGETNVQIETISFILLTVCICFSTSAQSLSKSSPVESGSIMFHSVFKALLFGKNEVKMHFISFK